MDAIVTKMEEEKERKRYIQLLLEKRKFNMDYLKRVHEEARQIHWMNVTLISPSDFGEEIQKRKVQWFNLGLSLAPLSAIENGPVYVRSLLQLMEEFEYHFFLHPAVQGVKLLLSSSKQQGHVSQANEVDQLRVKIQKVGNAVIYDHLKVYNNPIEQDLDYFQVVYGVCEVLVQVYSKLDHASSYSKNVYEAITKVDSRLKELFFGFLSKELTKIATRIAKDQVGDLDSLFAIAKEDCVYATSK